MPLLDLFSTALHTQHHNRIRNFGKQPALRPPACSHACGPRLSYLAARNPSQIILHRLYLLAPTPTNPSKSAAAPLKAALLLGTSPALRPPPASLLRRPHSARHHGQRHKVLRYTWGRQMPYTYRLLPVSDTNRCPQMPPKRNSSPPTRRVR